MNNADTVYNTLKRCLKKKCHEYIYVHDLDFSLKRERGRGRERESCEAGPCSLFRCICRCVCKRRV